MSRIGMQLVAVVLVLAFAAPLQAQANRQFRADMRMSGDALDAPASGTMYFGGSAVRMEISVDGENMILLTDPGAGTNYLLMPDDKMYMEMVSGMVDMTPPMAMGMSASNPCAGGDLTDCERLGTENVNGHPTTKWSYMSGDGTMWTSWVANDIDFPVRMVDEDGTTTDLTNVQMGAQPASLFQIPDDYEEMDLGFAAAFGGAAGRGGPGRGRGAPPGGRGAPGAPGIPGGFPPGFDPSAFGVDAATLQQAMARAGADNPGAAAWEAVEGWTLQVTLTQTVQNSEQQGAGSVSDEFTGTYTASIPLNYATPGVGLQMGPAWQHMVSLGSERLLAQPLTISVRTSARHLAHGVGDCTAVRGGDYTTNTATTGTFDGSVSIRDMTIELQSQSRLSLAPDLKTYSLLVGILGRPGRETTTGQTDYAACPGDPAHTEPINETREISYSISVGELTGLPLPGAPGVIQGSQDVSLSGSGVVGGQATMEWTLTPIR